MAAMAVKTESLYHSTDSLILSSPRKYYRAYMHADHWQLRSFIDSPKSNHVYYPAGQDIYRLDTASRTRKSITTLPFSPRCLVSASNWICCGGEHGNFAAVRLGKTEGEGRIEFAATTTLEADSRLPLDLEPVRRLRLGSFTENSSHRTQEDLPLAKATKFGTEIVNCVTLWFPPEDTADLIYNTPVAVLSNNDHSISIVDLPKVEEIERLQLDDCVNRAVISPNGSLLIAVGDDPFMHIYQRNHKRVKKNSLLESSTERDHGWMKSREIQLPGQRQADKKDDMRGSFAVSFSPSGRYLAIGTQYGAVCIFDTQHLLDLKEDPLITTFNTTRPYEKAGAIRAMEFSPSPFDLLAWTEDSGRVIVADIRSKFVSRQVINVDASIEGTDSINVTEQANDLAIDPRLRGSRTDSDTAADSFTNAERRQLRHLSREFLDRVHTPLTPEDTEVLDVLQMNRRRREREAARDTLNNNVTTTLSWSDLADDLRANLRSTIERRASATAGGASSALSGSSALPSSLREFVSSRSNDTLRAYINERNQERARNGQALSAPRRRGSVILAAAQNALDRDSQQVSSGSGTAESTPRFTSYPREVGAHPNNPWSEMEALYRMSIEPPDPTTRMQIEVEDEARRAHLRADPEQPGDVGRPSQRRTVQTNEEREQVTPITTRYEFNLSSMTRRSGLNANETTGCSWSQDGRILYVGTEIGIYEYHVNVSSRKFFPSIVCR